MGSIGDVGMHQPIRQDKSKEPLREAYWAANLIDWRVFGQCSDWLQLPRALAARHAAHLRDKDQAGHL